MYNLYYNFNQIDFEKCYVTFKIMGKIERKFANRPLNPCLRFAIRRTLGRFDPCAVEGRCSRRLGAISYAVVLFIRHGKAPILPSWGPLHYALNDDVHENISG